MKREGEEKKGKKQQQQKKKKKKKKYDTIIRMRKRWWRMKHQGRKYMYFPYLYYSKYVRMYVCMRGKVRIMWVTCTMYCVL
jgi:hypothetical protein